MTPTPEPLTDERLAALEAAVMRLAESREVLSGCHNRAVGRVEALESAVARQDAALRRLCEAVEMIADDADMDGASMSAELAHAALDAPAPDAAPEPVRVAGELPEAVRAAMDVMCESRVSGERWATTTNALVAHAREQAAEVERLLRALMLIAGMDIADEANHQLKMDPYENQGTADRLRGVAARLRAAGGGA